MTRWERFLERRRLFIETGNNPPVLTKEEEFILFTLLRAGNDTARNLIILSNMRLVTVTAKRYKNFGLPMEDLMGEGTKGLIRATDLFDISKGWKFSSYAPFWIRQTIGNALEKAPIIYIPPAKRQLLFDLNKNLKVHNLSLDDPLEVISERLGIPEKNVMELIGLANIKTISYEQLQSDGGWNTSGSDEEPLVFGQLHKKTPVAKDAVHNTSRYELNEVGEILSRVSQEEATILDLRLNLTDTHPKAYGFDEISKMLQRSPEQVIKIYGDCILRLKANPEVLDILRKS